MSPLIPNFTTQFWPKSQASFKTTMNTLFSRITHSTLRALAPAKFFLAATLLLASCKKESDIGIDIQPDSDLIDLQISDSTTLVTYTVREDSVRTDETTVSLLGSYVDPIFGKSSAGIFTQLMLPNNLQNIDFGATAVLDSMVLTLAYKFDYYGDTTSTQNIVVYQMTEALVKDSNYFSNHLQQFYPTPIGQVNITPKPRTKVVVGTDTLPAHIRIPIDPSFANLLFSQSGTANLANNTNLLQFFKGVYITPNNPAQASGQGSVLQVGMRETQTALTMYYHTATDTTTFSLVVPAEGAYYDYYTHDYSGTPVETQLNAQPGQQSEVFLQSMGGVKTKIEFPFLDNWKNLGYNIAINQAELVIKADPSQATSDRPINTRLFLVAIDSLGRSKLLVDMTESLAYYGGTVNTTNSEYRINLARHFQDMLSGDQGNYGFYLKEISPTETARRAVIGGGDPSSPYKMYLHLVYTRIN
jgi:hypothetical protein